jgi:hypothetical protein
MSAFGHCSLLSNRLALNVGSRSISGQRDSVKPPRRDHGPNAAGILTGLIVFFIGLSINTILAIVPEI